MNSAAVEMMARFDRLSLRERALLAVALLGLLLLLWHMLLMQPLERQRRVEASAMRQVQEELTRLEQALAEVAHPGGADPNLRTRADIAALSREVAAADAELQSLTSGLIAPREMARVLSEVLKHKTDLQLLSLRSVPGEALLKEPAGKNEPPSPPIYKHGVELELTGTYLNTLRFLGALQTLPWRFFWERIDLQVEEHPQARVRLRLYTLSLEEGWIGV